MHKGKDKEFSRNKLKNTIFLVVAQIACCNHKEKSDHEGDPCKCGYLVVNHPQGRPVPCYDPFNPTDRQSLGTKCQDCCEWTICQREVIDALKKTETWHNLSDKSAERSS